MWAAAGDPMIAVVALFVAAFALLFDILLYVGVRALISVVADLIEDLDNVRSPE